MLSGGRRVGPKGGLVLGKGGRVKHLYNSLWRCRCRGITGFG